MLTINMKDILTEKRQYVLWLQWLLALGIAYLLSFNKLPEGSSPVALVLLVIVNAVLNAGLFFLPLQYFQSSKVDFALASLNILMVGLAIYLTGQSTSDFYLFFFIILLMAAAAQDLKTSVVGVLISSGLYVLVVYRSGVFSFTEGFLLRIPLLFIVGLFFGYLVYFQNRGREEQQEKAEIPSSLFDFGEALVQAEDLEVLYPKIPQLINDIMMADGCELALIEGQRITHHSCQGFTPMESPALDISRSIHQATYQSSEIYTSSALKQDPQFTEKEDAHLYPYQSYMGKSWKSVCHPSGLLAVYRHEKEEWSSHDIKKFQFLTGQIILALQHIQVSKEFESEARTDKLTGLANDRYFSERMEQEFARARRQNSPLSLILMDMDHFKAINDKGGQAVGDKILRCLATMLENTTRPADLAGRCGGDEFGVLLPASDIEGAGAFSHRLIEEVNTLDSHQIPKFSISIGCSTFPHNSTTITELFAQADEALYFAKAQGRGSSCHYSNIPLQS